MPLTDIRVILMVLAVVGIVYFLYNRNSVFSNEGSLENENMVDNSDDETIDMHDMTLQDVGIDTDMDVEAPEQEYMNKKLNKKMDKRKENDEKLFQKMNNRRNSVTDGLGYKTLNYADGHRSQAGSWESDFDEGNLVIPSNEHNDNTFAPNEITNGNYAPFKTAGNVTCGSNQECEPEDLFNADKMLPQEVNDDWYQVLPEPVSVKNRHLINVTRPIGVNTIGNSTKNASYDIRGTIPNPRTVVSPFLNSSIEPDHNIRPCLC